MYYYFGRRYVLFVSCFVKCFATTHTGIAVYILLAAALLSHGAALSVSRSSHFWGNDFSSKMNCEKYYQYHDMIGYYYDKEHRYGSVHS
jgi:hypothetical protein